MESPRHLDMLDTAAFAGLELIGVTGAHDGTLTLTLHDPQSFDRHMLGDNHVLVLERWLWMESNYRLGVVHRALVSSDGVDDLIAFVDPGYIDDNDRREMRVVRFYDESGDVMCTAVAADFELSVTNARPY